MSVGARQRSLPKTVLFANQKAPPVSFYWSQVKNLDQEIKWLRRSDPSVGEPTMLDACPERLAV